MIMLRERMIMLTYQCESPSPQGAVDWAAGDAVECPSDAVCWPGDAAAGDAFAVEWDAGWPEERGVRIAK